MISVVLIGNHQIVRHGLRMSLEASDAIKVLDEGVYGQEAVDVIKRNDPDIAFLDISLSFMDGIDQIKKIVENCPRTRVVVLIMQHNARIIKMLADAGAVGFLTQNSTPQDIEDAIIEVANNGFFLKNDIAAAAFKEFLTETEKKPDLSRREIGVIRLISEGKSIEEVSTELSITPRTVQTHLYHAMKKLDFHTRKELVQYAIQEGLIPPTEA